MSIKRKSDTQDETTQFFTAKRRRPARSHDSQPQVDSRAGQAFAFPELDQHYDEEDHQTQIHGETPAELPLDPSSYIRNVRAEASGIPSLLVATANYDGPRETGKERDGQGHICYYSDGVFLATSGQSSATGRMSLRPSAFDTSNDEPSNRHAARDNASSEDGSEVTEYYSAKDVYTTGLLNHFAAIRSQLRSKSSEERFTPDPQPGSNALHKTLTTKLRTAYLRDMTNVRTLHLLRALTEALEWEVLIAPRAQSLHKWAWALLVKLDDVGTLSTEEVGIIRELGKKALMCLGGQVDEQRRRNGRVLDRAEMSSEESEEKVYDVQQRRRRNTSSSISDLEEDFCKTRRSLNGPAALVESMDTPVTEDDDTNAMNPEDENLLRTRSNGGQGAITVTAQSQAAAYFTLDMIITIVGEIYGQRDLLDGRVLSWRPAERDPAVTCDT